MKFRKITRDVAPPTRFPLAGLTRFSCQTHGFIVDAVSDRETRAWCPCGREGKKIMEAKA